MKAVIKSDMLGFDYSQQHPHAFCLPESWLPVHITVRALSLVIFLQVRLFISNPDLASHLLDLVLRLVQVYLDNVTISPICKYIIKKEPLRVILNKVILQEMSEMLCISSVFWNIKLGAKYKVMTQLQTTAFIGEATMKLMVTLGKLQRSNAREVKFGERTTINIILTYKFGHYSVVKKTNV